MKPLLLPLALLAGATAPVQAGINHQLRGWARDPALAALVSFAVGMLALVVYCLALRVPWPEGALSRTAWWHWTGGVLGAFFVTMMVVLAPRVGAATTMALALAGQAAASIVLDHYGWLGYAVRPLNGPKLLGMALLVAGVVLIRRY